MRSRGFSLIELLISLALAGVVVAGALQLHVSFNGQTERQQQIADMQQSLRVSMQILERGIRAAGSGMIVPKGVAPPTPPPAYMAGVMMCGATKLYAFEYWDNNNFPAPYTTAATTTDGDPDYFKIIASQPDVALATAYNSGTVTVAGPLAGWNVNDLVLFLSYPTGAPPPNGVPLSCLRTITNVSGQQLTFASPGVPGCNPAPENCLNSLGLPTAPVVNSSNDIEIKHFVNELVYRVIPAVAPGDTPKLAVRQAPIGNVNVAQFGWLPIADNIEDMQLAMIMSDGSVCNAIDDPSSGLQNCDPSQAMAVRITLVARSTNTIAGNPPAPKGGFEDEPMTNPNDGYLRRSMTTEILFRNR